MHIIRYNYPPTQSCAPAFGCADRASFTGFENEIDRLLGATLANFGAGPQFPVGLSEDKDNVYVRAELPGVSREEINLEIADGRLTIAAERKEKTGEQEASFALNRSVDLPSEVQTNKATASYENGVLKITLPKREDVKPQKIAIS